jgi:uncharacterized protein with PIN domain
VVDSSKTVAVIMSEEAATVLPRLARDRAVWVVATAETERSAAEIRRVGGDITTFKPGGNTQADLLDLIDEIELHHGADSGGTLSTIEVFGASAGDALLNGLDALGFRRVEAFEGGFAAHRS